ncbi:MAG: flagellar biosynthesis protein FliQ [Planctomycetota bacterium]|jgi:flagellar biosynthetic protein FliQ
MDASAATDLTRQGIMLVVVLAAPVLGTGLVVALIVSVLQAVTQVHDQTLSFVPKIIAMLLALVVFGPWMIARVVEFGRDMFGALP